MKAFKRFQNEHVISALLRYKITMGFPSIAVMLNYLELKCSHPKPFDLCSQVYSTAKILSNGDMPVSEALLDGSAWPAWRLSDSDESLVEAVENEANANLRQAALAISRDWQYCEKCVVENKNKNGVSYWHSAHQMPGVTHCTLHNHPLNIASGMKTLEKLKLPQFVLREDSRQYTDSQSLLNWSCFTVQVTNLIKSAPEKAGELRNVIESLLTFESKRSVDVIAQCKKYTMQFEKHLDGELLKHLFTQYSQKEIHRKQNLVRSALFRSDVFTVRNPIYYLSLLYWLKERPEVKEVLNDFSIAA